VAVKDGRQRQQHRKRKTQRCAPRSPPRITNAPLRGSAPTLLLTTRRLERVYGALPTVPSPPPRTLLMHTYVSDHRPDTAEGNVPDIRLPESETLLQGPHSEPRQAKAIVDSTVETNKQPIKPGAANGAGHTDRGACAHTQGLRCRRQRLGTSPPVRCRARQRAWWNHTPATSSPNNMQREAGEGRGTDGGVTNLRTAPMRTRSREKCKTQTTQRRRGSLQCWEPIHPRREGAAKRGPSKVELPARRTPTGQTVRE
jgi:hypothetical protein